MHHLNAEQIKLCQIIDSRDLKSVKIAHKWLSIRTSEAAALGDMTFPSLLDQVVFVACFGAR